LSRETHRVRANGENLHKPRRKTDRRLHHRPLRLISEYSTLDVERSAFCRQDAVCRDRMMTMVSLETRSLLLRPFAPSDVEPMLAMSQEDCARKWLPSQVYRDEAHAASAIDWLIRQFDLQMTPKTNAFVFGVEDKATARLIGHVGLSPLSDG